MPEISLCTLYRQRLRDSIQETLGTQDHPAQDQAFILEHSANASKIRKCGSNRTAYYLGILPTCVPSPYTDSRLPELPRLLNHSTCILLAGRIWGAVRQHNHQRQQLEQRDQRTYTSPTITFPTHLARIFPTNIA
jgi:hypothetical protein